jgi:uncharacterized protein (UPF0548 family)
VIEEPRRYGFAYGTLAEHAESVEERFVLEWHVDFDDTGLAAQPQTAGQVPA